MCAAVIPRAFKIKVMKPSDQDGSLTTATTYLATHGDHGFPPSAVLDVLKGPHSQLLHKAEAVESSRTEDELQTSGTLMKPLPAGDTSRCERWPYSLLLYRPGPDPPLILTAAPDHASVPLLTGQSLPQSQVVVTTSATTASTDPTSMAPDTHSMDPAWLHILSHTLSTSSSGGDRREEPVRSSSGGDRGEELVRSSSGGDRGEQLVRNSPAVVEKQPSPTGSISVPCPALKGRAGDIVSREGSLGRIEAAMRISLADLTNKLTTQQCPVTSYVGTDVVSSTVSTQPDSHSHPEYMQTFINKSGSIMKQSGNSSEEENWTAKSSEYSASTVKNSASTGPMIRHVLGASRLTQVNTASSPMPCQEGSAGPLRESHNLKERRRRARIKDACNLMRQLVPGMSHKTDKATVFEFSARYIHFLKSFVGPSSDKEFLVKYSPY